MTFAEWSAAVTKEFQDAGFTVEQHQGFPLVKRPETIEEGARLIEWQGTYAVEKRIYAEGMLIVPAGSPHG